MRRALLPMLLIGLLFTGCNGQLVERVRGVESTSTPIPRTDSEPALQPAGETSDASTIVASINGYGLTAVDIEHLTSIYGLRIEAGDFWYDPISGAWGFWGGPTIGFIMPYLELGSPPFEASGGGTGVVLNGRELHPQDVAGLQQLLGPIFPGYYWLDASGNYGYEGGPALGNLIYVAQGSAGNGGGYYDSTYFGNIGSDGQSSYFYDSDTGCSVMSDGVSC